MLILLECKHIQVNIADNEGNTALHIAVMGYTIYTMDETILDYLLCYDRIAINAQNLQGKTPLHLLLHFKARSCFKHIKKLLACKKILLLPDEDGNTPWHIAAMYSALFDTLKDMTPDQLSQVNPNEKIKPVKHFYM